MAATGRQAWSYPGQASGDDAADAAALERPLRLDGVEVRSEVFLRLSEEIGAQLEADGASEREVLDDFAASRRRR